MIYTKRKNLERYLGLSKNLDTAIRYLLSTDLETLAMGRNEIDGDEVFVNRFGYSTMPAEQAVWEGHIRYGDIHVLLSGREQIGVSDVSVLKQTAVKPDEDFVGYEGPIQTWCPMGDDDILIVWPEDAHMVKVILGESTPVQKACFKFKV